MQFTTVSGSVYTLDEKTSVLTVVRADNRAGFLVPTGTFQGATYRGVDPQGRAYFTVQRPEFDEPRPLRTSVVEKVTDGDVHGVAADSRYVNAMF